MAPLWLDVLDETVQLCAAYRRADLVGQLQRKREQLLDPTLRVLVAGGPKQGKSQLVNALGSGRAGDRTPVPVAAAVWYTPSAYPSGGLVHAEIGVSRDLLRSGLVLIDTP